MSAFSLKTGYVFCIFLVLLLFVQVGWAEGSGGQEGFQEACSAYNRGEYKAAIQGFENLAREGVSAPLLYNLANSYAQDGQSGRAVLNYERALRLAPGDSDIRGNLELVRKERGLFQEEHSFGQRFAGLLGLNQWTVLALVGFTAGGIVLLMPVTSVLKRRPRFIALFFALLLAVTAVVGVVGSYRHWNEGVVVAEGARLRVSPFESAASTGVVQEGRLLRPGKSHNNYVLVVDETGRSGWLAADGFELIATP